MSRRVGRSVWLMTIGMVTVALDLVHLSGIVYTLRKQGRWPLDKGEMLVLVLVLCVGGLVGLWGSVEALRAAGKERPALKVAAIAMAPLFVIATAYNFLVAAFSGIGHG